jgi:NADH-quinone oxidoreductase subunit E
MPLEMASAVNLLAHPVAGAAAASALGFGLASHVFGLWMGALTGAAEASQRLFQPMFDESAGGVASFADVAETPAVKARAATRALIADAQSFARDVADTAAKAAERIVDNGQAAGTAVDHTVELPAAAVAPADLMPEDFRPPRMMDRPESPDDLKAISGVGPKLEKVLNGLGIWTYGQIAGWTREEVAWVDDSLGFKGRIGRDDWIGQAVGLIARNKA